MCIIKNQLQQLCNSEIGAIYQCSSKNCYWLEFAGEWHPLKVSDFLFFKKEIDSIDLLSMLEDPSRTSDLAIVQSYRARRCFLLNVHEILQLRDLLSTARFMIELNSVLHERLKLQLI
jgi:hypothetical protein